MNFRKYYFTHIVVFLLFVSNVLLANETLSASSPRSKNAPQIPSLNSNFGIKVLPSSKADSGTMIVFHGYGGNRNFVDNLRQETVITDQLVGFNFPDHDIGGARSIPVNQIKYGTIQELLPAFSVLKKYILDEKNLSIHLYGFSAGGGAVVSVIAILNQTRFDVDLASIGIRKKEKTSLLKAIQNGYVILDCPLKSMDEILSSRESTPELEAIATQYRKNALNPIDSLKHFKGLRLRVLVNFQVPDDVLSNRDDSIFIERLRRYNQGYTQINFGKDGGHNDRHSSLWKAYSTFKSHPLHQK